MRGLLVAGVMIGLPGVARAEDVAVAAGVAEVLTEPGHEHVGVYPYAAVGVVFPAGPWFVIPSLGVEYSPEVGRWGLFGAVTLDVPVSRRVGVDFIGTLSHDQPGAHWDEAELAVGAGLGLSIATQYAVLAPSLCVYRAVAKNEWSLVPGLNAARAF